MNLLNELKRRNVFRVGLFYIVSAWLIVQVAETLLPIFEVPDGVLRAIVLVMALGFIPALLFAWAFELTPEGIKREKDVRVDPEIKRATGQKLNWATLVVAIGAIALLAIDRLLPSDNADGIVTSPTIQSSSPAAQSSPESRAPEPLEPDASSSERINPRSVAVLPFTTRSSDPEDVFFTDGMHDDLLTQLAKIGALKVISRTSVMEYAETTKKIPEIAEELGVAAIVEGGVQRAGNRVRINAQLIAAETDLHLWAETFDRELTAENVFEIQSDIARSIASALQAALTPSEERHLRERLTDDLLAWEAYRRSLSYLDELEARSFDLAEVEARRALELDKDFAAAHALLARAHMGRFWFFGSDPADREAAWSAILEGRAIDPDSPQLDIAEAYYHYWGYLQYDQALAAVERALAAIPNDAELHKVRAYALRRSGRFAETIASLERAHTLDPRNALATETLVQTYAQLGHFDMASRWLRIGQDIAPDSDWIKLRSAELALATRQDIDTALHILVATQVGVAARAETAWFTALAAGRFDMALQLANFGAVAETHTSIYPEDMIRGITLRISGDEVAAQQLLIPLRTELEEELTTDPTDHKRLKALCQITGALQEPVAARDYCARTLETLYPDAFAINLDRLQVARGLALASETDEAFAVLELTLANPVRTRSGLLRIDPMLDPLKADPRFDVLMRRIDQVEPIE